MLEGIVVSLISTHDVLNQSAVRGFYHKIKVISGGLLAQNDEIEVDNYRKPKLIYGIVNGSGDFMRILGKKMGKKIDLVKQLFLKENLE